MGASVEGLFIWSDMTDTPLITVVIPTRNRPELLVRAVRSAIIQTYDSIEVVVVIDGPDQASVEALSGVGDARLRFIELKQSGGGNPARNIGVSAAKGDWVALLDDDDEWLPDKLLRQVEILRESEFDPRVVVSCRFVTRSPAKDVVWPRRLPGAEDTVGDYIFDYQSLFDGEAALKTSTLLLSKQILEDTRFSTSVKKHQEIDFLLRASASGPLRLRFAREVLAIWNVDTARPSINNERNWRRSLDWVRSHRQNLTRRAYAGFLLVNLASESSGQGEWSAFLQILREVGLHGSPSGIQLVRYVGIWLLPQHLRQKVRLLFEKGHAQLTGLGAGSGSGQTHVAGRITVE
jgi:glycosyltransferase involved in cell wall biosynthesis